MKPIGGYFELERGPFGPLHNGVLLNSGRSALRLIVRLLKISRLHAPYYTCPVVNEALAAEGCTIEHYELDDKLMPSSRFSKDDFILVNDYFGVTGGNVAQLATEYPNLIVDNAQSYFAKPLGRAAFYSPRKFMGLSDGAIGLSLLPMSEPKYDCVWMVFIVHAPHAGIFNGVTGATAFARDHVREQTIYVEKGTKVAAFTGANQAIGTFFLRFDTCAEAEYAIQNPANWLEVNVI